MLASLMALSLSLSLPLLLLLLLTTTAVPPRRFVCSSASTLRVPGVAEGAVLDLCPPPPLSRPPAPPSSSPSSSPCSSPSSSEESNTTRRLDEADDTAGTSVVAEDGEVGRASVPSCSTRPALELGGFGREARAGESASVGGLGKLSVASPVGEGTSSSSGVHRRAASGSERACGCGACGFGCGSGTADTVATSEPLPVLLLAGAPGDDGEVTR